MAWPNGFTATHRTGAARSRERTAGAGLDQNQQRLRRGGDDHPGSGWHQATSSNGSVGLAVSGDVCNARALRAQLGADTCIPLAQLMIAGYLRWSNDFPHHVDGVFSLALQHGEDLFLYRDGSGLSNLFYAAGGSSGISFSTSLDDLVDVLEAKPTISRSSVHEYLRFGDIASPNTVLEGTYAVDPGRLLRWSERGLEPVDFEHSDVHCNVPHDFVTAVDALQSLMERGVDERIAGANAPAAFLSGGVDSSLVCALAARSCPDLTAVTVGFEGDEFDESPVAARIGAHLNLRHEVLRFSHEDYLAAFDRLTRSLEQPMADPATLATVLALEHCRDRYDVVLDGTGADEAVGAMPPRHVRLAVGWGSLLPTALRLRMARMMRRVPPLAGYAPILDFEHPADTMIRWQGFSRTEIEALCGEPVSFEHTTFYRTFARFPRHAHFERYTALQNAMPCERLTQASRVTGVCMRYPFCDRDTDQFIRHLPRDFRHLPGEPKRILRALLARHVPREIWDAPKHGFSFPLGDFLTARNHELVRRHLLDSDVWRRTKLLSAEGVQRYGREFIAGNRRLTFRVWALAVLGAWLEHHDGLQA